MELDLKFKQFKFELLLLIYAYIFEIRDD